MTLFSGRLRNGLPLISVLLVTPMAWSGEGSSDWKPEEAAKYLDEREKAWFEYSPASRGEGMTQSTCVSCHSVLPYVFARPILRKLVVGDVGTEFEKKLLAQTKNRVANWKNLDTAPFGLMYDFNEQKKKESWGTEAVLNAVILSFHDRYEGRSSPGESTKQGFSNLWQTQVKTGEHKGSWDWLDFGMGPWEWKESRYWGATLAAVAVGTAPGYAGGDDASHEGFRLLRGYLKDKIPTQNLHNQAWTLWAASSVEGILTKAEQQKLITQLLEKQQEDGGWSLPLLGKWARSDGTSQETASDGYATGLVLHVLQTVGVPKDDVNIAKGLDWLRGHQTATGAWRTVSVNKKRDPNSHSGKFMSDAATAFAVLALSH
jgi:squalene-hopene/tetraprenyl-beta-curcumene cyclase